MGKINTYAINLARRTDRKASLISEFKGRNEFQLTVVPAIAHKVGAIGLWQTICQIIQKVCNDDIDNILICEDDHVFTEAYTSNRLIRAINQSRKYDADILLGGVSWFDQVLQVDKNLFWVDRFTGTQFMLIYRKFYEKILEADLGKGGADRKISSLTDGIFVMYPYISVQKEFGYSDVTKKNEKKGWVTELFDNGSEKLAQLDSVRKFYGFNTK